MSLKTWFVINAVIYGLYGLGFALVPAMVASTYGVKLDAGGALLGQFAGSLAIGSTATFWMARGAAEGPARRGIVGGAIATNIVAGIASLLATLGGVMNAVGWQLVALSAVFVVVWGYFWMKKPA